MSAVEFPKAPLDKRTLEESTVFSPRFDAGGLVTVVVTDAEDGMLLMVAHMNAEALALTLETGIAHYWSRSRSALWKKGETSGNVQKIVEMLTDCDQDAIWLRVKVMGHDATCHTGRRSCFYRTVGLIDGKGTLASDGSKPLFDAQETYRKPHEPSI
jgi:phosphoribosyl-AMP cyclohydrolase